MMLLVDLAAVFLVLCGGTALLVSAVHTFGPIDALPLPWRSRARFGLLIAPPLIGALGVFAALLPSLGDLFGINDHCLNPGGHDHAHLCFIHQRTDSSRVLVAIAVMFGIAILARWAIVIRQRWQARRVFAAVVATSAIRKLASNVFVISSEVPICITVGVLRPAIYISSAAVEALGPACTDAALAHERGHVARHETRTRLLGAFAETFHLPGVGRALVERWHHDSELSCDLFAAKQAGSTTIVAEALVRFHRASMQSRLALQYGGACLCARQSPLDVRIRHLLAADASMMAAAEHDGRLATTLGVLALLVGIGLQSDPIHHALETLVGFLQSALT